MSQGLAVAMQEAPPAPVLCVNCVSGGTGTPGACAYALGACVRARSRERERERECVTEVGAQGACPAALAATVAFRDCKPGAFTTGSVPRPRRCAGAPVTPCASGEVCCSSHQSSVRN